MHKKIDKMSIFAFVFVMTLLISLTIGNTLAYFSSSASATGGFRLGQVDIDWYISDGTNFTKIANEEYVVDGELNEGDEGLSLGHTLTIGAKGQLAEQYVRVKLSCKTETADYSSLFSLYLNNQNITSYQEDWKLYDGYYYYLGSISSDSDNLTSIPFIDKIKLADVVPVELFSSQVAITLTIESIQTANDADQSVWGVDISAQAFPYVA